MGRCLNRTVLVSPVIESALRYMQFLTENWNGLTFFIATNRLLLNSSGYFLGITITPLWCDEAIVIGVSEICKNDEIDKRVGERMRM